MALISREETWKVNELSEVAAQKRNTFYEGSAIELLQLREEESEEEGRRKKGKNEGAIFSSFSTSWST